MGQVSGHFFGTALLFLGHFNKMLPRFRGLHRYIAYRAKYLINHPQTTHLLGTRPNSNLKKDINRNKTNEVKGDAIVKIHD